MRKQIKSKERVAAFGEVYTAQKQVDSMLALVPDDELTTSYFEPACGNGNFLIRILERKWQIAASNVRSLSDMNARILTAFFSMYGVDIQRDNVIETRNRLFNRVCQLYQKAFGVSIDDKLRTAIKGVLKYNIVCGNTLACTAEDGAPLTFSDWHITPMHYIVRKDYLFSDMLANGGESTLCVNKHCYRWLISKKEAVQVVA